MQSASIPSKKVVFTKSHRNSLIHGFSHVEVCLGLLIGSVKENGDTTDSRQAANGKTVISSAVASKCTLRLSRRDRPPIRRSVSTGRSNLPTVRWVLVNTDEVNVLQLG